MAPGQTSCRSIGVSGSHLKSIANSSVRTASETAKLMTASNVPSPPEPLIHQENAARATLMTRETARRKPTARMPAMP